MVVREGFPTKTGYVLASVGAVAGLGALWRYPHLTGLDGSAFLILYAAAWLLVGFPLVLAALALGHGRPRNAVDAYQNTAPRGWGWAGRVELGGALLAIALLSTMGGWAARYMVDAFTAPYADDPAGHFASVSQGRPAMLQAFLFLAGAALASVRGFRRGLTPLALVGVPVAFLLVAGLATYANLADGDETAWTAFAIPHFGALGDGDVVRAGLAAVLATGAGAGVLSTLASAYHDPLRVPRPAAQVAASTVVAVAAIGLFLLPLLVGEGLADASADAPDGSHGGFFVTASGLFAQIGGTLGGVLAGSFWLAAVLLALLATAALLEVPVAYLLDRYDDWERWRAATVSAIVAFALTLPFVVAPDRLADLEAFVSGVLAPLAGIALAVRVAFVQRTLLDGLRLGRRAAGPVLRAWVGIVAPLALAALAILGALAFAAGAGWVERGSSGLWPWVP